MKLFAISNDSHFPGYINFCSPAATLGQQKKDRNVIFSLRFIKGRISHGIVEDL